MICIVELKTGTKIKINVVNVNEFIMDMINDEPKAENPLYINRDYLINISQLAAIYPMDALMESGKEAAK